MNIRSALGKILRNGGDRAFWHKILRQKVLRLMYSNVNIDDLDIMSADWDTLIILDACRYDLFRENKPEKWPNPLPVVSKASNTVNFYERNFQDEYSETVVVTANPRTVKIRGDSFYNIIPVYESHWNDKYGTVMPDDMAKETIRVHKKYPNKRILSHWIQPHYPFIGSDIDNYPLRGEEPWRDLERRSLDVSEVKQAYEECFNYTIPYINKVIDSDSVSGRLVVSSDHGNAFGETPVCFPLPIYGHPRNILMPKLVTVPWVVHQMDSRRKIISENTTNKEVSEEVESKLQALGYQ